MGPGSKEKPHNDLLIPQGIILQLLITSRREPLLHAMLFLEKTDLYQEQEDPIRTHNHPQLPSRERTF